MVKNQQCVLDNLIRRNIIKYRGDNFNLTEKERQLLITFSSNIRKQDNFRYILSIPENRTILLRSMIAEILYLAVEKDFGQVYFITDAVGKAFITSMLYEMHTGSADLKSLLLKFQSDKIKILENKRPRSIFCDDLIVHFRDSGINFDFIDASKEICILTLRDLHQFSYEVDEHLSILTEKGWISFKSEEKEEQEIESGIIKVKSLKDENIARYFASIEAMRIHEKPLKQYMEAFGYFYTTVPIPLQWYDYYKNDGTNGGFNVGKRPSESVEQIKDLSWNDCLLLKGVCTEMEARMADNNEKYVSLLNTLKQCLNGEKQTALLMPNKLIADAFLWGIEQDQRARPLRESDFSIYYPEKYFTEVLMDEKKFDTIVVPFVPSPEILLTSKNLSKNIQLCLYPQEEELFKAIFEDTAEYANRYKLTVNSSYDLQISPRSSSESRKLPSNSLHKRNLSSEKRIIRRYCAFGDLEVNQDNYSRFLKILADGDPSESDEIRYANGFIDHNSYECVDTEGNRILLPGHESIILFDEKAQFAYSKYRWVYPRYIRKGDTVILVPHDVRIEFLKGEVMKNMTENYQDLEILIGYVAEWKAALLEVNSKFNFVEIQQKLANNGLERTYVAISKWFEGLYDNPKLCAFMSIIDSKYNIGPKNADDIRKFGETFSLSNLVKNYRTIHAAMATFRSNNQHIGRIAMKQIIAKIDDPDIREKCQRATIQKVKVYSAK